MLIFGYPLQIWIAVMIAVLIKLQSSRSLTIFGVITTVAVAIGSGMLFYGPAVALLSLSESWNIIIAILIALSAENLMKSFVELSADKEMFKNWAGVFIKKKLGIEDEKDNK